MTTLIYWHHVRLRLIITSAGFIKLHVYISLVVIIDHLIACVALILYPLMIACFTTVVSSTGCWFVWFDWRRNYTHVGLTVMDSCFLFWMMGLLLLVFFCSVPHWCLMFVSCLYLVLLAPGPLHF